MKIVSPVTNDPAYGGEGAQSISGWDVSNVHYSLADGSYELSAVEFNLDKPASVVSISLDSTNPLFNDCTNLHGFRWLCVVDTHVNIAAMEEFKVVAVGAE